MFEMENMTVRFPFGEALRGASLRIAPGNRMGIVGESGSGKSMLAACLMGMVPGAATLTGRLTIDGVDMTQVPGNHMANHPCPPRSDDISGTDVRVEPPAPRGRYGG